MLKIRNLIKWLNNLPMPKLKFKILNSNLTGTMVKEFKIKEDQEEDQMCLTMIH